MTDTGGDESIRNKAGENLKEIPLIEELPVQVGFDLKTSDLQL